MNEDKISWGKVIFWVITIFLGFAFWIWLGTKISGCFDSGHQTAEQVIYVKKDTAAQVKIDSLNKLVEMRDDSIEVLNEKLREVEQSRHEIIIKYKTANAVAEIKPMNELYPQMRSWLSPGRSLVYMPCDNPLTPFVKGEWKVWEFDSLDILSMAKKKNENEFLFRDNELLTEENTLLVKKVEHLNYSLSDEKLVNKFKDEQILKLESIPRTTISSRKWYVDAGIVVGAFSLGYLVKSLILK